MSQWQNKRTKTVKATVNATNQQVDLQYTNTTPIGHGSFGVVYQAMLTGSRTVVAIKKVLQDKRYQNRELQILRKMSHPNLVKLKYFFYSTDDKKDDVYLNLIMEFVPDTVSRVTRSYTKLNKSVPMLVIKLYTYQLFRGISFLHFKGVCHRDIKPQNLLVNKQTEQLKVCDFGSAKYLVKGESNVAYICSRFYRAPELILGATGYTNSIDVWSCGCVFAELMIGKPVFPGDSGVDQLVQIIRLLGTPTREQIEIMNPNYVQVELPQVKAHPLNLIFRGSTPPEAITLMSRCLDYVPASRITPLEACAHDFFNELRAKDCRLPNGRELPSLFNFTEEELTIQPTLNQILIPPHVVAAVEPESNVVETPQTVS